MKAVLFHQANEPVAVTDFTLPAIADRVEVHLLASALNRRDLWITKGMYPGLLPNVILGSDGVGMLEGDRVVINPGLNWGDNEAVQAADFEVLGMPSHGTFAEYIRINRAYVHPAPEHLSDHEAAALPLAGVTAYRTLIRRCQAIKGEKVLVTGAGGGVAMMAVQMAAAIGCEVYVTSGQDEKIQRAVELGAAGGVNYKTDNWHKELLAMTNGGVNVVIDSAGGSDFGMLPKVCLPGARIGFYGGGQGKWPELSPQLLFWRQVSILGSTMGSPTDFAEMLQFVTDHKIAPIVDKVFSLDNTMMALSYMERGEQFGKIVIDHRSS